jgi:phenylacetate-coenzyme A ligase PaaK-like adenylate-forming protein
LVNKDLKQRVLSIQSKQDFELLALDIFRYQYKNNNVYRSYCDSLKLSPEAFDHWSEIPFLPISAFKNHHVTSLSSENPEAVFESSGTTGMSTSKHPVYDLEFYDRHAMEIFEKEYGAIQDLCILALLPSYLERSNSSLVHMVNSFIAESGNASSGFYKDDLAQLKEVLDLHQKTGIKTLLIGVSFALLDLAELVKREDYSNHTFMETGGMKGRRKELPREELHAILSEAFNVKEIHSEYGMTELLSQSYSHGKGIFKESESMRIVVKEITDPFTEMKNGKSGVVNIIDLGNVDSCSFIQSEDLGKKHKDGNFEIIGRLDHSDIRGCSLLYT